MKQQYGIKWSSNGVEGCGGEGGMGQQQEQEKGDQVCEGVSLVAATET